MKQLTKKEKRLILSMYPTYSVMEISQSIRKDYNRVYWFLWKNGYIEFRQESADYNNPVARKVLWLYVHGWYMQDIAQMARLPIRRVETIIKRQFGEGARMIFANTREEVDSYTGMTERQMQNECEKYSDTQKTKNQQ